MSGAGQRSVAPREATAEAVDADARQLRQMLEHEREERRRLEAMNADLRREVEALRSELERIGLEALKAARRR